jgi:hypothetical protein
MLFPLLLALLLPDPARLTFTKSFPGSSPDYYRIVLSEEGQAVYTVAPDDDRPVTFQVSADFTRRVFELASQLGYFRGPALETKKKLANMGRKTVLYERGAERGEQSFNYSELPEAQELTSLFEKLSATQQHLLALERQMRFDKLALMKQLLLIDSAVSRKDLAEPNLLVPMLEEIARNKTFLGIAQQRAKIVLAKIPVTRP